jgi:4-amino-4-deoxy-L-arabinose transferase-like glycosyltransferase
VLILVASLFPRLATLRRVVMPSGETAFRHFEGDELVFQALVEQVDRSFFHYSLQGTPLLSQLNHANYDQPVFFHPPAFVYAARLLSFVPLPLVPVLMNLSTIALVFFIGRRLFDEDRALWAAVLVAVCPVCWFVSQKIWLDNMLILMVTASMAAMLWAADVRRPWAYALAGGVFGIAFLAKGTALVMLLPLATMAAQRDEEGLTATKVGAFVMPAAACIAWWELTLRLQNGEWTPSAFPNAEMIAKFPFVAQIVARPWYFYVVNLAAITPVYVLALDAVRRRQARDLPLGLWFVVFWVAATAFGLAGGGYQTRYLAPGYPALALLTAQRIPRLGTPGMLAVVALVGYGMMNALIYAITDTPDLGDFQFSAATLVVQAIRDVSTFGH